MKEERWADIEGYNQYQVSDHGRVKNKHGKLLKPYPNGKGGYLKVKLAKTDGTTDQLYLHRTVAEAFIPNPQQLPLVEHLNNCRTDCRRNNLAWGTHKSNADHKLISKFFIWEEPPMEDHYQPLCPYCSCRFDGEECETCSGHKGYSWRAHRDSMNGAYS